VPGPAAPPATPAPARAHPADLALALLAGPGGARLGGAVVHAPGAEEAERWTRALRAARAGAAGGPWRVVPAGVTSDRLEGGVDIAATLAGGRLARERGLLAEAEGGVLALPRAAAATEGTLARLAATLDDDTPGGDARAVVVAVVTGDEREALGAVLAERLALHVALPAGYDPAVPGPAGPDANAADDSPAALTAADVVPALWAVADALGVASPRAVLHALRTARALAALAGRAAPAEADMADAVRLTLAPRATQVPADAPDETDAPAREDAGDAADPRDTPPDAPPGDSAEASAAPSAGRPPDAADRDDAGDQSSTVDPLSREMLVAAARSALPADLLAGARTAGGRPSGADRGASAGRRAALAPRRAAERRGRLVGVRPDLPRGGPRLALVDTLRAAAPWQPARGRRPGDPLTLHAGDLRVERRRRPLGTTTVVLVDASGSAALGRLAEAKGAVELLLAESYARRDRVALVAFRGAAADVLLPPTRALARARRAVSALPAGGGTPLAAALVCAAGLAGSARREGARPAVVLLTDGRANVALDGTPGRARAREEAHGAARALAATLAAAGGLAVVVDTTARAGRALRGPAGAADAADASDARALALALGARYVALPHVDARALHAGVRAALDDAGGRAPRGGA
jgi:magnesium chelatase subunit D